MLWNLKEKGRKPDRYEQNHAHPRIPWRDQIRWDNQDKKSTKGLNQHHRSNYPGASPDVFGMVGSERSLFNMSKQGVLHEMNIPNHTHQYERGDGMDHQNLFHGKVFHT